MWVSDSPRLLLRFCPKKLFHKNSLSLSLDCIPIPTSEGSFCFVFLFCLQRGFGGVLISLLFDDGPIWNLAVKETQIRTVIPHDEVGIVVKILGLVTRQQSLTGTPTITAMIQTVTLTTPSEGWRDLRLFTISRTNTTCVKFVCVTMDNYLVSTHSHQVLVFFWAFSRNSHLTSRYGQWLMPWARQTPFVFLCSIGSWHVNVLVWKRQR